MTLLSFDKALEQTRDVRRHLLLGNGFSLSLFPDRFHYGSLLEKADFSQIPEARQAFETLETISFEMVIHRLRDAAVILPLYEVGGEAFAKLKRHADALRELLVQTIAARHPERPSDVGGSQYGCCCEFLSHFAGEHRGKLTGHLYTLNHDLLLYWVLLHGAPAADGKPVSHCPSP